MEFTIETSALQRALHVIGSVAKPNSVEPAGQVVIEATDKGDIIFLSTNGKTSVTSVVRDCDIKVTGVVSVLHSKLASFIGYFKPLDGKTGVENVKFKNLKGGVSVNIVNTLTDGSSTKGKLNLKFYEVYKVAVPKPFEEADFSINASILRTAISKVVYAINVNEQRPFMQGMNMRFDKNYIYFAGTDALKLSEYKVKNNGKKIEGSYIIPYRFIMSLRKIVDAESPVFFEISDTSIKAALEDDVVYGPLIEGHDYPDYIPLKDNYENSITINKDVMLDSFLPFLSTLSDDDNARVTIEMKDGKLKMFSDFSESEYAGEVEFKGEFVSDVNGNFLAQTLAAIQDDIIDFNFSDAKGLLLFNSSNFKDQFSLITPIRRIQ